MRNDRLLFFLKSRGEASARQLAEALEVTPQAVRQQLDVALAEGLVAFEDRPEGKGRPRRYWRLSEKGHGRFPDRHSELTLELIEAIRTSLGEETLNRLIAFREIKAEAAYKARVKAHKKLRDRVGALAAVRAEEGYMARVERDEEGAFLLIEDHCPICAAASICQGFCRAELQLFQAALGKKAQIERTEHLLGGGRRCVYRITKSNP